MRLIGLVLTIGLLFGCATDRSAPPPDLRGVRFETYPYFFCGGCHTVTIFASDAGQVWLQETWLAGPRHTARARRRMVHVSSEALDRFRARLDRFRPHGKLILDATAQHCTEYVSDDAGVNIDWRDARGEDRLEYNFGCEPQTRRLMREDLRTAPSLLQIHDLHVDN